MKLLKKEVLKCLQVRKCVYIILLRPYNIPKLIVGVVDVGILRLASLCVAIVEDMLVEVDLGHKI